MVEGHRWGDRQVYRGMFAGVLAFWVLSPLLLANTTAQDGPAFVAAARIAEDDPAAAYALRTGPAPDQLAPPGDPAAYARWRSAYCEADPTEDCGYDASFLSPPPALLLYVPFNGLSASAAVFAIRLVQAGAFAIGMTLVARSVRDGRASTERWLLLAAVALTPVVVNVLTLGQNTGFVFVAAALGAGSLGGRWRSAASAVALGAAVLVKLFPGLLVALQLWRRRWTYVLIVAASLLGSALLAGVLLPESLWQGFLDVLGVYRDNALRHRFNRSFDAVLRTWLVPDLTHGVVTTVSLVARTAALFVVWYRLVRRLGPEVEWTFVLLAAMALNDYSWPHYLALLVPFAAALVRQQGIPIWTLTAAGVVGSAMVGLWSRPLLSGLAFQATLATALGLVPWLAARNSDRGPAAVHAPG